MNVTLSPEQEEVVRRKVASGQFEDANGVVDEAFRLMEYQDKLERLKAAIDIGHQQFLRGEVRKLTPELIDEMNRLADEEDRLGLPIPDEVQPQR